MRLVVLLCVVLVVGLLFFFIQPQQTQNLRKLKSLQGKEIVGDDGRGGARPLPAEAHTNLRQIGLVLQFFKDDYQTYPSKALSKQLGTPVPSTANEFLIQLFASGLVQDEKAFSMKGSFITPDGADGVLTKDRALQAGELHWAYVEDTTGEASSNTPLLIEPYRPGETSYRPKDYGGARGVLVLMRDLSVQKFRINERGELIDSHGREMLSVDNPGWKNNPPIVHQPEMK